MAVTVATIINNAKVILQETGAEGIRWTNDELCEWLNEFYQSAVGLKPDVSTVNTDLALAAGTKQLVPLDALRLIDVVRNTNGRAVRVMTRHALDNMRRGWHSDPESTEIECFVFDDMDPQTFYVYPPAAMGASLEIIYSTVPESHDVSAGFAVYSLEAFKLQDAYAPCATDYILYRAFSKDAETGANLNRAQVHYSAFMQQLTGKSATDNGTSPNAPDLSANA